MGTIISELAKEALQDRKSAGVQIIKGIPVFPKPRKGVKVTMNLVNRMRDEFKGQLVTLDRSIPVDVLADGAASRLLLTPE
ncbi:MAG: hypothetical protein LDLANPLL_00089 [Turneriella sp.]|nr:hypothetical protein [Turneriella sp.]